MAEAVIQNLHRKWSDALQCQPSVNYARGRNQNYRDGARTSPQKYKSQGSPRKQYNRKKDFSSQARSKDNADPAVEHVELQDIPENAGADKDLPFSVARRATVVSHPSSQQPPAEAEAMQEANQVDAKAIDHALMSAEKEQLQALSGRAICEFKSTPGENSTDTAELGPTESHFEVCSSTPTTSATAPAATQRTPKKKKGRKQSNITTERSINEAKQNRSDKKSRKTSLPEKLEDSKQRKELISGFGKESGEANVSESIKCSGTLLDSSSKVLGKDSNNNPELAPSDTTQWPPLNTSKSTTLQPDVSGREQYGMKQQNTVRKVTSSESSGLNFEQLGTKSSLLTDPSSDGQSERLLNETATESIAAYDATDKERTRHESSLEVSSRPAGDIAASNTANIPDGSIPQHSGKQNSIEQELVSGARSQAEESVKFSSGRETHKKNPVSQPIETKSTNIKQSHSKTTKGRRVIKENASKTQSAKAKMPLVTDSKEIVQKDSLQPMPVPNDPLNSSFPKGNKFTKSHAGTEMVEKPSNCVESITLPAKTEPSIESALVSDHSVKAQIHLENTALPRKHAIDECMDEKTKSCQDTSDQRAMKSNVAADATRPSEVLNESKSVNAVQVPNKQFYELDSPTSLATSTTPIYTHKKKQKKLSLIESKSSNPYEALGSETVENPTQELSDGNINVKGKELQVVSSHLPNSSSEISTGVGVIVSSVNENEDSSTANKGFSGVSTSNPDGRSKSKKKLKKSKKARSSQSNLALVSSNQSSLNQANGSRTLPSVETPFLTDDKKPLPRPVIHNRPSGDKATKGTPSNYQCVLHSNSVILVEEWLKYRQGNPFGQTRLSGDLEDYSNEKEAGYEPGLYSLFPENAINQDHSAQNNGNTFLPLRSISADYDAEEESQSHKFKPVVYPVQGTESEANNQVAVQHELDQSKCPGSNDQEDGSTEEQVRSNQVEVDRYLKANGKASREALLRLLNSIVPEKESPKSYGDGEFGSAESRELGDVLPEEVDIASPDGAASGTPRVFEIIEEIPPLPPPPRSLKQRDIRLLPSRSPSPTVPISRDESEIERPELTPLTTANTTPKAESQPRTPPPGMFHQSTALRELHHHTDDPVSPPTSEQHQIDERQVIGASEEITNPPLPTEIGSSATISPIHTPKVKTLSYKDVASTPPASSLQESDFPPLSGNGKGGHVGPKAKQENRERGRAGSAAEKKRRASQKADPWRVVSTSWGEPTTKHTNK